MTNSEHAAMYVLTYIDSAAVHPVQCITVAFPTCSLEGCAFSPIDLGGWCDDIIRCLAIPDMFTDNSGHWFFVGSALNHIFHVFASNYRTPAIDTFHVVLMSSVMCEQCDLV